MAAISLLAKSAKDGVAGKGLVEHSKDVMDAFEALFGKETGPSRLGQQWLRFFRLREEDYSAFHKNGLAACALHDIGKANDGFQAAVRGNKGAQLIWHEHLSALVLSLREIRTWLKANELDADIVSSAVAAHHLRASPQDRPGCREFAQPVSAAGTTLRLHSDNEQFKELFSQGEQALGMTEFVCTIPQLWSLNGTGHSIPDARDSHVRHMRGFHREVRKDHNRHRLLMAVKGALIAADAAGSGLIREGIEARDWIGECFGGDSLLSGAYIEREVIKKRVDELERRNRWVEFQKFQLATAELPDRALLLAPCGSGKTLAAWKWIASRLEESPAGRTIFLYPTRATATEGFRDYVSFAPETDAALASGTARYELADMFSNEPGKEGKDYLTDDRLYAVGFWSKRIFSATVDQFFAFLQHNYRSLCLLPVLADSVVVIDEVHSFDVALFSALEHFLSHFNVPVLCMTASLPAGRRARLKSAGLEVLAGSEGGFDDLDRLAQLPRYRVREVESADEMLDRISDFRGKCVLWVVNTVDRCQALARRLADFDPLCFHSRYTLDDRKERHREVVRAFQDRDSGGVLAITTQVCEMSLDLDAEVLISEYAPIPALIQRMGRCNRYTEPGLPPGDVCLYQPDSPAPYERSDLDTAGRFVAELAGDEVSQARLENLLENYTRTQSPEGERLAAFTHDGPWACAGDEMLRDGVDYTVPAVLNVDRFLELRGERRPTDGLLVPVPRKLAARDPRLGRFPCTAPASHYDSQLGFLKEPVATGRANV